MLRLLLLIWRGNASSSNFLLLLGLFSWIENVSSSRRWLVESHSSIGLVSAVWNSLYRVNRDRRSPNRSLLGVASSVLLVQWETVRLDMLLVHVGRWCLSH